jgi:hypothetical protein
MSLIEVMVVIAILIGVAGIVVPTLTTYTQLEQRRTAKELALSYEMMHDEAVLRNVTFRVSFHLDEGYYEVEVGRPETLIFARPEDRESYEEEQERRLRMLTEREKAEVQAPNNFQAVQEQFGGRHPLPSGTVFRRVYTPQYGKWVEPTGKPDEPAVVQSHIFASGFAEHTVIQLVDADDPDAGYTIEVEPLSGDVRLHAKLIRFDESFGWIPDEGPELP